MNVTIINTLCYQYQQLMRYFSGASRGRGGESLGKLKLSTHAKNATRDNKCSMPTQLHTIHETSLPISHGYSWQPNQNFISVGMQFRNFIYAPVCFSSKQSRRNFTKHSSHTVTREVIQILASWTWYLKWHLYGLIYHYHHILKETPWGHETQCVYRICEYILIVLIFAW